MAFSRLAGSRDGAALISQNPFLLIKLRFKRLGSGGFKMKRNCIRIAVHFLKLQLGFHYYYCVVSFPAHCYLQLLVCFTKWLSHRKPRLNIPSKLASCVLITLFTQEKWSLTLLSCLHPFQSDMILASHCIYL